MMCRGFLGLVFLFGAASAQPGTIGAPSSDPKVERQVQAVADTLRCIVCKNQSIADSDAALAQDMVNLVREQIEAGSTEAEARAYIVERYGDFVLLKPRFSWRNAGLWFAPALVFLVGGVVAYGFIRRRPAAEMAGPEALTDAERAELQRRLSN